MYSNFEAAVFDDLVQLWCLRFSCADTCLGCDFSAVDLSPAAVEAVESRWLMQQAGARYRSHPKARRLLCFL